MCVANKKLYVFSFLFIFSLELRSEAIMGFGSLQRALMSKVNSCQQLNKIVWLLLVFVVWWCVVAYYWLGWAPPRTRLDENNRDNKLWDKNKIDKETISYYNMNMITQKRNASKMPDHDEDPIVYLVNIIPFPDPDLLLCANLSV